MAVGPSQNVAEGRNRRDDWVLTVISFPSRLIGRTGGPVHPRRFTQCKVPVPRSGHVRRRALQRKAQGLDRPAGAADEQGYTKIKRPA